MARAAGVYGDKSTRNAFRAMMKLYGRPISEAQRHGLKPVLKAAKANLVSMNAKDSGELIKSLVIKKDKKAPKTKPTHKVGPRSDSEAVRYAHLVEFGTDPHGDHPGTSPKPFLSQAFYEVGDLAIAEFGEKLGPSLEKQAARLAKKAGAK